MVNLFREPETWNDLFLPGKSKLRTSAFWVCTTWFTYALILAMALAFQFYQRAFVSSAYSLGLAAVAAIVIAIAYLGWRYLGYVAGVQRSLEGLSVTQAEPILSTSRTSVRIFYSLMAVIGMLLMLVRLLLVFPAQWGL